MQSSDTLFPAEADTLPVTAEPRPIGPFAAVALEQSVDRAFDYSIPSKLIGLLKVGHRVRVPLGQKNRLKYGYVVGISQQSDYPKIKPLHAIDDDRVLVRPHLMELARWISRYYVSPLGMVLETMVPSAVKRRVGLGYSKHVRIAQPAEALQAVLEASKSKKRRTVLSRLLQLKSGESIELARLAFEAKTSVATIKKLVAAGLITVTEQADLTTLAPTVPAAIGLKTLLELNADQSAAIRNLHEKLTNGFSVNLLFGVTGSGKTEVYLRTIEQVVAAGRQAIVLVPEIALTPQTVARFVERFPRVAVLHSALTNTERHRSWQRISSGDAQVIVGARSAIFAPASNLGLIVVDEEHESSYKQDTVPRYNARDVAIKRGQIENVPVILGTATPSLETWGNVRATDHATEPVPMNDAKYHLLRLPNRVRGLALPKVEVVDLKQSNRLRKGVHLISARLEALLHQTLAAGEQAILLLNRRGYANCIFCAHCNEAVQCKYCDATMTYHRAAPFNPNSAATEAGLHTGQLHCHYCLAVNPLPVTCSTCGKKLALFGLGTQRVEEELTRKFPDLKFARVDSDTMRVKTDYEALLEKFGRGEIEVMLGTQMIAKGLDYPNVTLAGVISGDTALSLPDFRAAERTFQLITQVAGRAGRGDRPGRVVLQTFLPEDAALKAAVKQDFEGFAAHEVAHRRQAGLPPSSRMVRIILRDQSLETLHKRSMELATILETTIADKNLEIDLRGPMPCPIERIAGYHRAQIVLIGRKASVMQRVLSAVRRSKGLISNDRVAIDVDPVNML